MTEGGATIGGVLTASNGLTITSGGLSVAAGGVTIVSSGANTLSTFATGSSAITAASTVAAGYTSSVLSVSSAMAGAVSFFLIKVFAKYLFPVVRLAVFLSVRGAGCFMCYAGNCKQFRQI